MPTARECLEARQAAKPFESPEDKQLDCVQRPLQSNANAGPGREPEWDEHLAVIASHSVAHGISERLEADDAHRHVDTKVFVYAIQDATSIRGVSRRRRSSLKPSALRRWISASAEVKACRRLLRTSMAATEA